MALNNDFKVKDTINVGLSGLFGQTIRIGDGTTYPLKNAANQDVAAIDAWGPILSGGRDLADFIGDGVDDIKEGTSNQGTIEFSTQTTDAYTEVEVLGLQTIDSPSFANLNLTGLNSGNTTTVTAASALVINPVNQAFSQGELTFTPTNVDGDSNPLFTGDVTVKIIAKQPGTSTDIAENTLANSIDGINDLNDALDAQTGVAATDYYILVTTDNGTEFADSGLAAGELIHPSSATSAAIDGGAAAESGANPNAGVVIIQGDLEVRGTTTTVDSQNLTVADKTIVIADGASTEANWTGAGINIGSDNTPTHYLTITDAAGDTDGTSGYWTLSDDLHFGDSTNTARLQGRGNADVSIKTGNATTGEISIANGAAGNISLLPDTTGKVKVGGTAPTIETNSNADLLLTSTGTNPASITVGTAGGINLTTGSTSDITIGSGSAAIEVVGNGDQNVKFVTGNATSPSSINLTGTDDTGGIQLTTASTEGKVQIQTAELLVGKSTGIALISGAAGSTSLKLETGNATATNTASITMADGANGDITIATNGTGSVNITSTETTQTNGTSTETTGVFSAILPVDTTSATTVDLVAITNSAIEAEVVIRKGATVQMVKLLAVTNGTDTIDGTVFGEVTVGGATLGTIDLAVSAGNKYQLSLTNSTGSTDDGAGGSDEDCEVTVTVRAITV